MLDWIGGTSGAGLINLERGGCLENVWCGTSAEDQKRWDERLPVLLSIPATVRFVSAEPLLGPISMNGLVPDWLIVGGESGPKSRPMISAWVQSLQAQSEGKCAFHFKQWGEHNSEGQRVGKKSAGRLLDGKEWNQLPKGGNDE